MKLILSDNKTILFPVKNLMVKSFNFYYNLNFEVTKMNDSKISTSQDTAKTSLYVTYSDGFMISRVADKEFNEIMENMSHQDVSVVSVRNGFVAHLDQSVLMRLPEDHFRLIDLRINPIQSSLENWRAIVAFLKRQPNCFFVINDTPISGIFYVSEFLKNASEMIGEDLISVVSRIVWLHDEHFENSIWRLIFYNKDGFDDSIYGMFEKNHTIARNIFREIDSRIKNSAK